VRRCFIRYRPLPLHNIYRPTLTQDSLAFSLFLPTIIKNLGYTSTTANLLSVPPYAAAAVATVLVGYIADRTQQRGLCNIFASLFGIAGFSMLLGSGKPAVQYAGVFLGALGIYPTVRNTYVRTACGTDTDFVNAPLGSKHNQLDK
jgi:MFS family permease